MRALCVPFVLFLTGCGAGSITTDGACPSFPLTASSSEESGTELKTDPRFLAYSAQLVGLTEATAQKCLDVEEITWRVGSRDGHHFPLTKDFVNSRINVHIVGSLVREVTVG